MARNSPITVRARRLAKPRTDLTPIRRGSFHQTRKAPETSDKDSKLSVAFTKEESAETAAETLLPDRPISPHPNLVTESGLKALERQLADARASYEAAQQIEDVNERRRQAAIPQRDLRYFSERVRTAQVVPVPASADIVAFGSTVTFEREDGRVQTYRIVGEDEADPKAGSISFASPVARSLMGKAIGDVVESAGHELEIKAIA
jgi:transcription elongation GreA/GreB family factor